MWRLLVCKTNLYHKAEYQLYILTDSESNNKYLSQDQRVFHLKSCYFDEKDIIILICIVFKFYSTKLDNSDSKKLLENTQVYKC